MTKLKALAFVATSLSASIGFNQKLCAEEFRGTKARELPARAAVAGAGVSALVTVGRGATLLKLKAAAREDAARLAQWEVARPEVMQLVEFHENRLSTEINLGNHDRSQAAYNQVARATPGTRVTMVLEPMTQQELMQKELRRVNASINKRYNPPSETWNEYPPGFMTAKTILALDKKEKEILEALLKEQTVTDVDRKKALVQLYENRIVATMEDTGLNEGKKAGDLMQLRNELNDLKQKNIVSKGMKSRYPVIAGPPPPPETRVVSFISNGPGEYTQEFEQSWKYKFKSVRMMSPAAASEFATILKNSKAPVTLPKSFMSTLTKEAKRGVKTSALAMVAFGAFAVEEMTQGYVGNAIATAAQSTWTPAAQSRGTSR